MSLMTLRGRSAWGRGRFISPWSLVLPLAALWAAACGSETVTAPPAPVRLAFVAQPGAAMVEAALAPALQVVVQDAQGRTVTSSTAPITISLTSGTGTAGAALGGTVVRNAVNGVATFDDVRLDRVGLGYSLTASSPSLTSATSTAFDVNAGAAARVVFSVQPVNGVSGSLLAPAVQATLQDALGNVATQSTAVITLVLNGGSPSTGALLGGTLSRPTVNGVATFNDLAIDKAGVNYTLSAAAPGLAGATSSSFAISPGAAARVVFTSQPGPTVAGFLMAAVPEVSVQDAQGNTVTASTIPISLSIRAGTGAAGAQLEGGLARMPRNGTASFRGLAVDRRGTGYVLSAFAQGLAGAFSSAFDVTGVSGGPNYVLLASDSSDYIGLGKNLRYTQEDAILSVDASGPQLTLTVGGDEEWMGWFVEPSSQSHLQKGEYADLGNAGLDPVRGGLFWFGEGQACNSVTGGFAIDSVVYRNGDLAYIDLRFVQRCDGNLAALRGILHWSADDPSVPPGPVLPIPANLWRPAPGATPATPGTFVYLESSPGDFIGQGQRYTYLPGDIPITVQTSDGELHITVGQHVWDGTLAAMQSLTTLQPGYYGGLQRHPFHNRAKGGLSWSGQGRGCNTLTGWFAVDAISYVNGVLSSIDARFEQHCEGQAAPLRGAFRWVR